MFDPKSRKYPYPEITDQHYIVVKKNDGTVFDVNYPYIDRSKKMRRSQNMTRFLLNLIVFPMARIKLGLKIKNRSYIKKYKNVLSNGVVSVSNHIAFWDYIAVMKAIRPFRSYVLVWAPNVRGENGKNVRNVGGIPIPENDYAATNKMNAAVTDLLKSGGWLHMYPEGSMWEYYAPIRPFKLGASYFAIHNDKPILPLGFSYRKPSWIRKHIFKQDAAITLTIGQPIYRDATLSMIDQEIDLTKRIHSRICDLVDIGERHNPYGPIFKNDRKVNYY